MTARIVRVLDTNSDDVSAIVNGRDKITAACAEVIESDGLTVAGNALLSAVVEFGDSIVTLGGNAQGLVDGIDLIAARWRQVKPVSRA